MSSRLRAIARDTVAIVQRGGYTSPAGRWVHLADDVTHAVANTRLYAYHRAQGDLRYSDRVIHSPGVPVFRDDKGRMLDEPYRVAFLTSAAPNAGVIARNQPQLADSVPAVLRERAVRVLDVAEAHGHRRLVLGAWGCGVFGNDPGLVADAFARALATRNRFDQVHFAVLDRHPGTPAYTAFARVFSSRESAVSR
ncbi:TIGR02452 family protein [Planomonospora parontospora]|uniref:TIGR02452 family protein n=1 Tax=Planomonospora parontospora TaxID=58119 RepID=UPI00166FE040|nr:TIGR02452 family protein [Planomonospora parontospora]